MLHKEQTSSSDNQPTIKQYSLNKKKKIAESVESLKSKKHFKQIFKIIYEESSNSYTKDSSGVYINFNTLSNETLFRVENYLQTINPKNDLVPLPSKYTPYFTDNFCSNDSGIRLSNHEKNFLKYIDNDSEIKKNLIDSDTKTSDSNIKPKIIIKPFNFE